MKTSTIASNLHPQTLLSLLAEPRIFTGHINAYRQPVGLATLQVARYRSEQIQSLQTSLEHYFSDFLSQVRLIKSTQDIFLALGEIVSALQQAGGLPIFEPVKLEEKNHVFLLWIPTLHGACYHQAMAFTLQLMNYYAAQTSFVPMQVFSDQLKLLVNQLKAYAPRGSNSSRLLAAAHQENIPWMHLAQNTFQYGYGCQSRWFDSTFTDKTSQLGAKLARSKICTLSLLRKAGLPVPEQQIVQSAEDAVAKASKMGYPVVIKPYDQDGGKGVFAELVSDNRLKKAYQEARGFSETVLLEKHVPGKDYRLLVLDGELIWAIERIPPSVTGDGKRNIAALIESANGQSERSNEEYATLKCIKITADMTDYLYEQGLDLASIPHSGQIVVLNPVANISTGGMPAGVLDKVHPDNKRLVETAAALLRLDIAGVDFIIPDIQQSYLKTGGKIIEINSQPQLGTITAPHIYKQLLSTLLPNQGRIPIIVVCGNSSHDEFVLMLQRALENHYVNIGMVKENIAYLNSEAISHAPSWFNAVNALLLNRQVDVLICCINHRDEIASQGLAFDRYDFLFFLGEPKATINGPKQTDFDIIDTLFNACLNPPVILENFDNSTVNSLLLSLCQQLNGAAGQKVC